MKASVIKKNPKLESKVDQYTGIFSYDPLIEANKDKPMDNETMIKLGKLIAQLDKKEHKLLYKLLRKHDVSRDSFALNATGMYFTLNNLPNNIKWLLHRNTRMGLDNLSRQNALKNAQKKHDQRINTLDETLSINDCNPSESMSDYPMANPSELEKIINMKLLQ